MKKFLLITILATSILGCEKTPKQEVKKPQPVFYRIKQVDADGTFIHSKVIKVVE
jgi:hypothetical protein